MNDCDKKIETLYSAEEIAEANKRIAKEISDDYSGDELLIVGILKGAFVFMADLCRLIDVPCCMDFICVSSYGSKTVSSGSLDIRLDMNTDVRGRNVLIVEDILDTGLTLSTLKEIIIGRGAKSVKICAMAVKYGDDGKPVSDGVVSADYYGLRIDNQFVVGYGLDCAEKYRNLPYLGIL